MNTEMMIKCMICKKEFPESKILGYEERYVPILTPEEKEENMKTIFDLDFITSEFILNDLRIIQLQERILVKLLSCSSLFYFY